MALQRHFEDFDRKALKGQEEDPRIDDVLEFVNKNFSDPHLNIDTSKLTKDDLELARRFQKGTLKEEAISRRLDVLAGLPEGNPSYNLIAAMKNKLVIKEGWRKRMAVKRRENS